MSHSQQKVPIEKPKKQSSGSLERPSLLQGLNVAEILSEQSTNKVPGIRTPWLVQDESLRPVPPLYPKLDPNCTAMIMDSTPSVVASRIADCLKKRSIAAEYDDETITATCMTVDRVQFNIHLHRGASTGVASSKETPPDLSHAVLVECLRTRGDVMSFHWTCRSILNAAMGHSSGHDMRQPIRTIPWEFSRLERITTEENLLTRPGKRQAVEALLVEKKPVLALERAATLLKKDRMGAQRLGMESLVCLSDARSSGVETAVACATSMLEAGSPNQLNELLMNLLKESKLPNESEDDSRADIDASGRSCVRGSLISGGTDSGSRGSVDMTTRRAPIQEDAHHGGMMRSLALRVLANSLLVLSREQPSVLRRSCVDTVLTNEDLLYALVQDVMGGSTRSPIGVIGTRLASPHEATLAAVCLNVSAKHSPQAKIILQQFKPSTWDALEKAHGNGRNDALTREADCALQSLSGAS